MTALMGPSLRDIRVASQACRGDECLLRMAAWGSGCRLCLNHVLPWAPRGAQASAAPSLKRVDTSFSLLQLTTQPCSPSLTCVTIPMRGAHAPWGAVSSKV